MNRLLVIGFVLLLTASAVVIVTTTADLPARVASHFVSGGRANGWQSVDSYRTMMLGIGIALPLVLAGLMSLRTDAEYGYGVGALAALLVLGIHLEVVAANARTPAYLDESHLFAMLIAFGIALLTLIVVHLGRERR